MRLFSARKADEHFDPAILEIHLERYQCQSFFGGASNQFPDFVTVQEEFPLALFSMIGIAPVTVWTDMHVHHPDLTALGARVAVAQVDASFADRLDLGTEKRDARFIGFEDVIVVACLAIVGNNPLSLFALGLLRHSSTNILDA